MKTLLFITVVVSLGCKNPNYCPGNPDQNCNEQMPGDGHPGDGSNAFDCTAPGMSCLEGVCDTTSKQCADCTATNATECAVTAPICRNDMCTPCESNTDCPLSNTCLPSGACADVADVAYVRADGTGTTCSSNMPCATIAIALSLSRPYVHVTGAINESVIVPNDTTKTIIGERDATGKTITSTIGNTVSGTTLLALGGTTTSLTLVDLAFVGTLNNLDAVQLSTTVSTVKLSMLRCLVTGVGGYGIEASHGDVSLDRTSITNSQLGGLNLSATTYHVKNSFLTHNGGTGPIGGLYLSFGSGTIEFSTIANNIGPAGTSKGVSCSNTTGTFANVIVANNSNIQTDGTGCTFAYSDFYPTDANTPTGSNNMAMNPLLDPTSYHLMTGSPMKDAADPNATLNIDWDGDGRPQGAGRDIGADELMP